VIMDSAMEVALRRAVEALEEGEEAAFDCCNASSRSQGAMMTGSSERV
jgi:hypothetical protein